MDDKKNTVGCGCDYKKQIKGIACDVKNCCYNDGENACCAGNICVGPCDADCSSETVCATFKPKAY